MRNIISNTWKCNCSEEEYYYIPYMGKMILVDGESNTIRTLGE